METSREENLVGRSNESGPIPIIRNSYMGLGPGSQNNAFRQVHLGLSSDNNGNTRMQWFIIMFLTINCHALGHPAISKQTQIVYHMLLVDVGCISQIIPVDLQKKIG